MQPMYDGNFLLLEFIVYSYIVLSQISMYLCVYVQCYYQAYFLRVLC